MMNYLSFTSYSGWRKFKKKAKAPYTKSGNGKKKQKRRQSETLEGNLQLGIQNHPLSPLPPSFLSIM